MFSPNNKTKKNYRNKKVFIIFVMMLISKSDKNKFI